MIFNPMKLFYFALFCGIVLPTSAQSQDVDDALRKTLLLHKELVSIPNLPEDEASMLKNINWVADYYQKLDFKTSLLPSSTLPLLLAEKVYNPKYKTVLFYFHIDGQPVNKVNWDQEDPFTPVLKKQDSTGNWQNLDWHALDSKIDDEWRIFARAAADDKAPIIMFLAALEQLDAQNKKPNFNIKVIFDPEEEYGSSALLSTLPINKERYASDYFIVMDGPAHDSNKPTVTFGCRGIVTCSITTYGASLPQHSGHYGNYVPNPVFSLAMLLSTMKDDKGYVLIKDYYKGINLSPEITDVLKSIPYDSVVLNSQLGIFTSEKIGNNYQETLQYPSLNVRQIGTSWSGVNLKTVVPELAKADLDVRLVPETEAQIQLEKIRTHIVKQGYYVIDHDPTAEERATHPKIAKFIANEGINAFRTDLDSPFGKTISNSLSKAFNEEPIKIRMMGGTVPIVPVINALNIPTLIIPMVNMDNNQHSPNENIRIGNMRQGIQICLALLQTNL
ncbi:M20/M25/M40 family metallo-hydrolase [Leeuwenhoekiella sp. W20_SRS_FM14]|uniref:M20/M25/M40 family metallo-hydrolase n=1 Tax=Leeuwenhoekiella sp. W20_SRS_FM14 TaxID=3240270 RepID=UPI003F987D1B